MKPVTAVRLAKAAKAALNLCARRDPRIVNQGAWRDGLSGIAEGFVSRNIQRLDDDQVRALIAAAYAIDHAFGLYAESLALTGARNSQVARLVVGDLQADNGGAPRLMMPSSRKGGRGRKPGKRPVPISRACRQARQQPPGRRAAAAPCRRPRVAVAPLRRPCAALRAGRGARRHQGHDDLRVAAQLGHQIVARQRAHQDHCRSPRHLGRDA